MEKNFETEVLTRLAVIEAKIDDYKAVKQKTDDSYDLATHNKERIDKIEDNNRWLFRTSVGALITSGIGLVFIFIKLGIGVN